MKPTKVYNASQVVDPIKGKLYREYCVRVTGFWKPERKTKDVVEPVAGDGWYGFPTRRRKDTIGARRTAVGPRKPGCKLACRSECRGRDALAEKLAEVQRRKGKPRWRARKGQKLEFCR